MMLNLENNPISTKEERNKRSNGNIASVKQTWDT